MSSTSNCNVKYSFHYDDPLCFNKLKDAIFAFLLNTDSSFSRDIIYLCIGTDRATGDCLGPLVGTHLQTLLSSAHVIGTLEHPAHAKNLENILNDLRKNYQDPLIVAIDASLGNADRVGFINVKQGSIKPGTALKKTLPEVGDFYISGVVNVGGFLEHMVLQNTRLHTVYKMADIISRGIFLAQAQFDRERHSSTWRIDSSGINQNRPYSEF